jgi:hypothetical protein
VTTEQPRQALADALIALCREPRAQEQPRPLTGAEEKRLRKVLDGPTDEDFPQVQRAMVDLFRDLDRERQRTMVGRILAAVVLDVVAAENDRELHEEARRLEKPLRDLLEALPRVTKTDRSTRVLAVGPRVYRSLRTHLLLASRRLRLFRRPPGGPRRLDRDQVMRALQKAGLSYRDARFLVSLRQRFQVNAALGRTE